MRSRAEYFWVGAAIQVNNIITKRGVTIIPDYGKVILSRDGRFLHFALKDRSKKLHVKKVESMSLSPIAINIPLKVWNEETAGLSLNPDFTNELLELKGGRFGDFDTLIFFCRSGGRSQDCLVNLPDEVNLFEAYYEIDQPDGKSGRGGFEGTSYSNVYNGYRGFPERLTEFQDHPSVSWKDAGLPIQTSLSPIP